MSVVERFREKTASCFNNIGDYTCFDIEHLVMDFIKNKLQEEGLDEEDIQIVDLVISGSRCRGLENKDSDLDVVLEFESESWREYSLYDLLHEDGMTIEGVLVDINPITEGKTGTLEEYLPRVEIYLEEKKLNMEAALIQNTEELSSNNISKTRDYELLKRHLGNESLTLINSILDAYFDNRIFLDIPYDGNGNLNYDGINVVIVDSSYKENGFEKLVLKWIEDFEDTGYLIDCIQDSRRDKKKPLFSQINAATKRVFVSLDGNQDKFAVKKEIKKGL